MGNNPVTFVDPDGGYINMSSEGQTQRARFMTEQAYLKSLGWGRYSYDYLYPKYLEELERLSDKYSSAEGLSNEHFQASYLEDLMKLNNDFAGLGLATDVMSSGIDKVSSTFITNNVEVMAKMQAFNGEANNAKAHSSALYNPYFDGFAQGTVMWENMLRQGDRDRTNAWREKMRAEEESDEKLENAMNLLSILTFTKTPKNNKSARDNRSMQECENGALDNQISDIKRHGFSAGFRIWAFVIYDIKFGTPVWNKPYDSNFPGRKGKNKNNRFELFYLVPKNDKGRYGNDKNNSHKIPVHPFSFGFRWLYNECLWIDVDRHHFEKPSHR